MGRIWTDDEVFEAVLLAVLSSNTVWSKIERVQAELTELNRDTRTFCTSRFKPVRGVCEPFGAMDRDFTSLAMATFCTVVQGSEGRFGIPQ